jgi:hypothetical protein
MSDSEDEAVDKQLKIVVVGEAGSGKVKNSGPIHNFKRNCMSRACMKRLPLWRLEVLDTSLVDEVLL